MLFALCPVLSLWRSDVPPDRCRIARHRCDRLRFRLRLGPAQGARRCLPPHYRHGFWIEGGLGWGEEQYKFGNDPYTDGLGKPTFGLRLGGTVGAHFRLGAEWNIWSNSYQDVDMDGIPFDVNETLNAFMAIGRLYPAKSLGLFLKGGVGLGITHAGVEYGNSTNESGLATNTGRGLGDQARP